MWLAAVDPVPVWCLPVWCPLVLAGARWCQLLPLCPIVAVGQADDDGARDDTYGNAYCGDDDDDGEDGHGDDEDMVTKTPIATVMTMNQREQPHAMTTHRKTAAHHSCLFCACMAAT